MAINSFLVCHAVGTNVKGCISYRVEEEIISQEGFQDLPGSMSTGFAGVSTFLRKDLVC